MIFIAKTIDRRFLHLKQFLESKFICYYSDVYRNEMDIDIVVLPIDGIDQYGYIKHTNILLEKIFEKNKVKEIYCGKVNDYLIKLANKYNVILNSFYEYPGYLEKEFSIKIDVIKTFIEDKYNMCFSDIKTLVVGDCYESHLLSEKLNSILVGKRSIGVEAVKEFIKDKYDVIIRFDDTIINTSSHQVIIDMGDICDADLSILLSCRKIYFINQLLSQYLTKSSGKLMYDCMVNR